MQDGWPRWAVGSLSMAWLVGILPAFVFAIRYHESPNYLRETTVLEDLRSALYVLMEYLKYLAAIFVFGILFVIFGSAGP